MFVLVSVLLHVAVFVVLPFELREFEEPESPDEKPVEIVFEQPKPPESQPLTGKPDATGDHPVEMTPGETPQTSPVPDAPADQPPPEPSKPEPETVTPDPPQATTAPPQVRLTLPDLFPDEPTPLEPPAPLPPLPRPPGPQPRPRPRNEFTPFMRDYSFGEAPGQAVPGKRPGRGIDLSLGKPGPTPRGAPGKMRGDVNVVSGQTTVDWERMMSTWIQSRLFYPAAAVEKEEEGESTVRVVVNRLGRIESVELVGRSGSMFLDLATQAMFRKANMPPFPPDMIDAGITLEVTIHYILIR